LDLGKGGKELVLITHTNNLLSLGWLKVEYDKKGKAKYKCSAVGDMLIRYVKDIEN